jgi:starch-binding outer membrane protein, SusD/RagB family
MINKIIKFSFCIILIGTIISCKKEYINPNSANDGDILNSKDGLVALSVGMKTNYATAALGNQYIYTGATSRELKGVTALVATTLFESGASDLVNDNAYLRALWASMFRVMGEADNLIDKSPTVLASYPELKSGILAHAQIYKALTIGGLATAFEKFPIQTKQAGDAIFVTREVALQTAIDLLSQAKAGITATTPSTEFDLKILGNTTSTIKFSMINIINALTARYSLWLKKYSDAYNAANSVALTGVNAKSVFIYTSATPNPLYSGSTLAGSNFRPRESFGLPASLITITDSRFAFYSTGVASSIGGENVKTLNGFSNSATTDIPVYMPDEMKLIKAEAILFGSIPGTTVPASVLSEIDAIRTQTTGDLFGVNANLPSYSGLTDVASLTTEIYKQRCMELFCSGNKLEDSRRLGRVASSTNLVERNRNFYPYPVQERQNNQNTPADPAF